jgi:hypothetical protein
MHPARHVLSVLLVGLLLSFGCGSNSVNSPEREARVRILLTDAPADLIETAFVTVSRVYLLDADSEAPVAVDILAAGDEPQVHDLLTLRDGVTALLGEALVPAAGYEELRLVVDDATVTLAEGYAFRDGSVSRSLKVPSGQSSGIKVKLAESIPANEGVVTTLVVDFDVNENFRIQGNPQTEAGIRGVSFQPVLKEKSRTVEEDEEDDSRDPDVDEEDIPGNGGDESHDGDVDPTDEDGEVPDHVEVDIGVEGGLH